MTCIGASAAVFDMYRSICGSLYLLFPVRFRRPLSTVKTAGKLGHWGVDVQTRSREALRAEDLGPLAEGQVGGHQYGSSLVALTEDLERQFRPGRDNGTKPDSSMISRLRRDSCRWRLSRPLSSLASINSGTRAAEVVKPMDIPQGQAANPVPAPRGSCRCRCCRRQ